MQKHLDFKLYLDAATQSVTRTRNNIYLLLTLFVAIFAVYINTTVLDWSGARVQKMRAAYECISDPESVSDPSKLMKPKCLGAMSYANELGLPQDPSPQAAELYKEYRDALIRRRTDLRTIQLPLFGAVLDLNDLGILSAVLFVILLVILRTNLYHEFDSLKNAQRKAEEFRQEGASALYAESNEILSSVQVLASPRKDNRGFRWSAMVVMSLPIVLHALILWHDIDTRKIAVLLVGGSKSRPLLLIEAIGLVLLCLLWYSNAKVWLKLAYLFDKKPPKWVRHFLSRKNPRV